MTISVAVLGATGYTGGELVRLLAQHPAVQVTHITSERYAGKPLSQAFPHLARAHGQLCQPLGKLSEVTHLDLAFCALPHTTSMQEVPGLLARGVRVVDLSADFRLKDAAVYQAWYGTAHQAPHLLDEAVYGLPERNGNLRIDQISLNGKVILQYTLSFKPVVTIGKWHRRLCCENPTANHLSGDFDPCIVVKA